MACSMRSLKLVKSLNKQLKPDSEGSGGNCLCPITILQSCCCRHSLKWLSEDGGDLCMCFPFHTITFQDIGAVLGSLQFLSTLVSYTNGNQKPRLICKSNFIQYHIVSFCVRILRNKSSLSLHASLQNAGVISIFLGSWWLQLQILSYCEELMIVLSRNTCDVFGAIIIITSHQKINSKKSFL